MTDTNWNDVYRALGSAGISSEDAATTLAEIFGNPDVKDALEPFDMLHRVRFGEMLDGTPIVEAPPLVFQRNGIWYRADGTPIED